MNLTHRTSRSLRCALATATFVAATYGWGRDLVAQETVEADTARAEAEDSLSSTLVPIPVVFYQPETGLGFGATAVYTYYMGRAADAKEGKPILPSTIAPVALYTTKKQIIVALRAELFPIGSPYRLVGEAAFTKFPNKFWGIGNDTPDALEEDYTPIAVSFLAEGQMEMVRNWYFGASVQFAHRELQEVEPGGLLDSGFVPGAEDGNLIGLGLLFTYDTRRNVWYPRSSSLHQLRATLFDGTFGSDYEYLSVSLDLRRYLPLFGTHVLALRAYGSGTTSSPPFDVMPQLGGDRLLRGYFQGRYRDQDLVALQAEYRFPVWWRFGAAVFGGAGQVAPEIEGFRLNAFHTSAGFGVRFLLAEEQAVHLRADFAWGLNKETSGFYLGIGEAF
jgi:hypothetical protein